MDLILCFLELHRFVILGNFFLSKVYLASKTTTSMLMTFKPIPSFFLFVCLCYQHWHPCRIAPAGRLLLNCWRNYLLDSRFLLPFLPLSLTIPGLTLTPGSASYKTNALTTGCTIQSNIPSFLILSMNLCPLPLPFSPLLTVSHMKFKNCLDYFGFSYI